MNFTIDNSQIDAEKPEKKAVYKSEAKKEETQSQGYNPYAKTAYIAGKGLVSGIPKALSSLYNLVSKIPGIGEPTGTFTDYLPHMPKEVPSGLGLDKLFEYGEERLAPGIGEPEGLMQKGVKGFAEQLLPSMLTMGAAPGAISAIGSQVGGRGAEALGFGEAGQAVGEIAGGLAGVGAAKLGSKLRPKSIRKAAEDISPAAYKSARKLGGKDKVDLSNVRKAIATSAEEAAADPKAVSVKALGEFKENADKRLAHILDKPKADISELIHLDQQYGGLANSAPSGLKGRYLNIKKETESLIDTYGKKNPEFKKTYNMAKSLWRLAKQKPEIKKNIGKAVEKATIGQKAKKIISFAAGTGGIGYAVTHPTVGIPAGIGVGGLLTAKAIKTYFNVLKEPAGRMIIKNMVTEAAKKGSNKLIPYIHKLDKLINNEETPSSSGFKYTIDNSQT